MVQRRKWGEKIMEEMKKEIESLKRKTFYLKVLMLTILINVMFFSITQTRQYCYIINYYKKTIEMNEELNQILQERNQLDKEILSKIQ